MSSVSDNTAVIREVEGLRERLDELLRSSSTADDAASPRIPPTIPSVETGGRSDIVTNLRLLGTFPTASWEDDLTIPEFVGDCHDYRIGYYRVAECTVTDGAGKAYPIALVINDGNGDCNTGFWGGAFLLPPDEGGEAGEWTTVARFWSKGDTETRVEADWPGFVDHKESGDGALLFPLYKEREDYLDSDDDEEEEDYREEYFSGLCPGFCKSQVEKLLGLTLEEMMMERSLWKQVPESLKDYGDIV